MVLVGLVSLIFHRLRNRIGVVMGLIFAMAAAIHWFWGVAQVLTTLSLVCSFYFLFGVLSNTQSSEQGGFSGIAPYFFRLPVRSGTLVGAHLLVAIPVILAIYGLWFLLVLRAMPQPIFHVDMILFLLASYSLFSAVVWGMNRLPKLRVVLLGGGFFLLFGVSLWPLGIALGPDTWWHSQRSLILSCLAGLFVGIPWIVIPFVHLDRIGWVDLSLAWWNPVAWISNGRHFLWRFATSTRRALVIRELLRSGWVLPVGMLCIVSIMHLTSVWRYQVWGSVQDDYVAAVFSGLLVGGLWMIAFFQGILLSHCGRSVLNEDRRMSVDTAVLPISSEEVVVSKLWASAFSLALAWGGLVIGMVIWYWIWDVPPLWNVLEKEMLHRFKPGMLPSVLILIVFAIVLSWRAMMMMFPYGLSNRRGALILGLAGAFAQVALLSSIATWHARPLSSDLRMVVTVMAWSWLLLKVLIVLILWAKTKRRPNGIAYPGSVALVAWALFAIFGYWQLEWLAEFLTCPPSVLLPAVLVLMPLASQSIAPSLVGLNRSSAS